MVDRTTAYARLVVSGKKLVGRSEYLACTRHLEDLKRSKGKEFNYKFDVDAAEKAINIANELTIAEGKGQKKLETRGFQNFIIGSLHGWKVKRKGFLRYREAYVQMARQNGKSFIAGTEANNWASFSGYHEGRVFCTATKQAQADIVWDEVRKFIQSDADLDQIYNIKEHDRTIKALMTGTVIKSVGRDTKSADGFRSVLAIVDEYHAHRNDQMYKLMLDGQINVDSALTLAITTPGFNLNGPCYKQYQMAKKVLEGVIVKDSLFVYIAEMDKDDDIWDYHNWAKANPLLLWNEDDTVNMDKVYVMAEKAIDAKEKGGEDLVNFMTKSLGVWVTFAEGSFVKMDAFKACESERTLEAMRGRGAYLGIDLSSGGDLTSIALVFPLEGEKYHVYTHSFMPELRLLEHEKSDDAPYRAWVIDGLLTLTSGMFGLKTDYKYIIKHLEELIAEYNIEIFACGYDSHNASAFLSDLLAFGFDCIEVPQSAKSLSEATQDFALSVEALQVEYDKNNTLFSWSVANATLTKNSFGEVKIDKQREEQRIDPVDAVIDAWKIMLLNRNAATLDVNDYFDDFMSMML